MIEGASIPSENRGLLSTDLISDDAQISGVATIYEGDGKGSMGFGVAREVEVMYGREGSSLSSIHNVIGAKIVGYRNIEYIRERLRVSHLDGVG
jgi:hypothetical protein